LGEGYRSDIDGLRAVAVLSVLLFHAGFRAFQGGFTGVDIFFVISGFLIGGHIYGEEVSGRFRFSSFYRRRAKRILPALYVVICVVLLLGAALLSPLELQRAATEGVATLLFGSNVFFWKASTYFAVSSDLRTLLMTWSLGVEEQFYFVIPLMMVLLLRLKVRLLPVLGSLTVFLFCMACYQVEYTPRAAFYLLSSRGWELLVGVVIAVMCGSSTRLSPLSQRAQNVLGAGGILLILLPIALLSKTVPFPGAAALPSVIGCALVLCTPGGWTNRTILSTGALRFVGRISYSLYLWHWPLFTFTRIVLGENPSRLLACGVLAVSFVAATASYHWVEQPLRRSRTPARTLLMRYAAVTAVLIVVCLAVRGSYGLAFRTPQLAAEEKLDKATDDPCLVQETIAHPNIANACQENTGGQALALWGDSHAGSLAPVLREKAHRAGYDFIEMAKGSCPPLADAGLYYPERPMDAGECIAFNNSVLHAIATERRIGIVVLAGYWRVSLVDPYEHRTGWIVTGAAPHAPLPSLRESEQVLSTSLLFTITELQKAGKRVLISQDVPAFAVDPMWRIRSAGLPLRRILASQLRSGQPVDPGTDSAIDPSADIIARKAVEVAAESLRAGLTDPEAELCTSLSACRYRDSAHSYYEDNQHLTLAGAQAALAGLALPTSSKQ
jgi:peptidoglycan/LPS O-acetylase OafA/YrhL